MDVDLAAADDWSAGLENHPLKKRKTAVAREFYILKLTFLCLFCFDDSSATGAGPSLAAGIVTALWEVCWPDTVPWSSHDPGIFAFEVAVTVIFALELGLRAMPKFQEAMGRWSLHISLVSELVSRYEAFGPEAGGWPRDGRKVAKLLAFGRADLRVLQQVVEEHRVLVVLREEHGAFSGGKLLRKFVAILASRCGLDRSPLERPPH